MIGLPPKNTGFLSIEVYLFPTRDGAWGQHGKRLLRAKNSLADDGQTDSSDLSTEDVQTVFTN